MGVSVTLIFQIFALGIIVTVVEQLLNLNEKSMGIKVLNTGCYIAMIYVVLVFIAEKMMPEITVIFNTGF